MKELKMTAKKQSLIRTWFQVAWFVLTNGYIRGFTKGKIFSGNTKALCFPGLNCYSCPGALAACPMGALQAVMGDATYRVSLYVFGFLAALGVLFGRLICGWMCPFGFVQDLLYKIPFAKKIKNLPGHRYLKYLRYVILIVFVILLVSVVTDLTGTSAPWFCEWICPSGMLFGGIPLVAVNEGLREAIGVRFFWKLFVLIVILIMSVIVYRPFCKYLCPLGAIYGLFNPISSYRLVIDKDKCVSCGMCQKACGMDIKTFETPNSMDCIRCGSCIASCPEGAISSTWAKSRDRIKSRCFVDDDTAGASYGEVSATVKNKATAFGIMTILFSAFSMFSTFFYGLFSAVFDKLTIELYEEAFPGYIVFDVVLSASSFMLLMIGIYTLINRKKAGALVSVHEKTMVVFFLNVLAFVIAVIGSVIDQTDYAVIFAQMMYAIAYVAGVPFAVWLSSILKKDIRDGKKRNFSWVILSLFYLSFTCYVPILFAFSVIMSM